jgi:hypothetical protein
MMGITEEKVITMMKGIVKKEKENPKYDCDILTVHFVTCGSHIMALNKNQHLMMEEFKKTIIPEICPKLLYTPYQDLQDPGSSEAGKSLIMCMMPGDYISVYISPEKLREEA